MSDVFTPARRPTTSEETIKSRYQENEFGDGYEQNIRLGLNDKYSELSLTWETMNPSEGAALLTFFRAHMEASFEWRYMPFQPVRKWRVVGDPNSSAEKGLFKVQVTLREVFI